MTETEIRTIANEVLAATLGSSGYERVEVRHGYDHDGDPSLFVKAVFRPGAGLTDGGRLNRANAELRTRLLTGGEERFPYLNVEYPDDEVLVGDVEEP
ncbi:hypothetical protein [Methylobacterium oryzihabitans]|uniref:Uncharacterized protein n=1 Tax=Methylobacterium oryzihabitans TaxID=2499852 RepID=A0A3S2XNF0_9HYPH|nr:hypothetical protein [Methylobacterium oryzihabitans]RVU19047.1 hypothetical protein EOE48_09100 [Methylobacterium oryzihabitans]